MKWISTPLINRDMSGYQSDPDDLPPALSSSTGVLHVPEQELRAETVTSRSEEGTGWESPSGSADPQAIAFQLEVELGTSTPSTGVDPTSAPTRLEGTLRGVHLDAEQPKASIPNRSDLRALDVRFGRSYANLPELKVKVMMYQT